MHLTKTFVQIGTFNDYLVKYAKCGIIPGGFLFTKVKESNIFKKLINLKSSKATGLDNIPEKFLKDSANYITPMVTHIFIVGGGGSSMSNYQYNCVNLYIAMHETSAIAYFTVDCF